jgi:hypothetical protein
MRILVDETTGTRFVRWFETKNGMVEPTCATLHQWSTKGMNTLFIRCDRAGENHSLEETLLGRSFKNLRYIDKPTRSSQHRGRKDDHKVRKEALLVQLAKRLTPAELKFYNSMKDLKELSLLSAEILSDEGRYVETALVGAAGNKFGNTGDLNVLIYKQSMDVLLLLLLLSKLMLSIQS